MRESSNTEKRRQPSVVVIAKNGLPKFFKELLNIPDECCYKSCEAWQHEYELHIKDLLKI